MAFRRRTEDEYIDQVSIHRITALEEQQMLEGAELVSLETCGDLTEDTIYEFAHRHFGTFIRYVHRLCREDQDLILSTFMLSKSQMSLGTMMRCTQTEVSYRSRLAVRRLGCLILYRGRPSRDELSVVFKSAGIEKSGVVGFPLSHIVDLYATLDDFGKVAVLCESQRSVIRRVMNRAWRLLLNVRSDENPNGAGQLGQSRNAREGAIGAWLHGLTVKTGSRPDVREKKKSPLRIKEPRILGQFRVRANDPDFKRSVFASRSSISSPHAGELA